MTTSSRVRLSGLARPEPRRKNSEFAKQANGEDLNNLHPWLRGDLLLPIHKWLERHSTTFPSSTNFSNPVFTPTGYERSTNELTHIHHLLLLRDILFIRVYRL